MASSTASTTKDAWRTQFRAYRRSLSPSAYRARSSLIVHRALTLSEVARGSVVHVYWPLPDQGEIDTRPLIASLRSRGSDVVLPVVTSFAPGTPTLEHRRYEDREALSPNRWGIREPVNTERVPPEDLDLVIVPAVGAGRQGHRLGHGSGYYDQFLQSVACPRIGLVYAECLVPSLPHAPHDVPMTTLVTEQTTLTPGA